MSIPVIVLDEIDSTNSEAMRRAAAGECGPVWLTARRQAAGRGRSGRTWQSSEGNLAATLLFAPGCTPADLHQLSLVTGIAVIDGVRAAIANEAAGRTLRLKWPNDLLAGSAKLGGILIESTSRGSLPIAAVGIGINVAGAPAIEGRETASLSGMGCPMPPEVLLSHVSAAMEAWIRTWDAGRDFGAIRKAWLSRTGPIGEPISVNTGTETISGAFAGIDETGALLVASVPAKTGHMRRLTFGDVSLAASQDGIVPE